ncbi:MAG: TetR/AcrR family transcriptional regulator [Candidatus Omnitrophica bacterium]|nr:TetR/AcrR family transcriptional regulator [Candidatus Omnitrophota bacterium]MDE2009909.1 TetR/AcrR family transcriptional regulator [Candidatus Omnitrophota bacterium]
MGYSGTVRQREIIIAARSVIFSQGIENLTVRGIAKELKVTNGALYRHFKSKNEIISLLIDDIEETMLATIREAAKETSNPLKKLESMFLAHLSYSEQMRGTSFAIINQVSGIGPKHLKLKMFKVLNRYLKTIKTIVVQGMESGIFRKDINPASASILFFGSIQSMVTLWCLSGYKLSLRKVYFTQMLDIYKSWIAVC